MPYHSIDTERKVKLILEHLQGERICSLARRYNVDEDSIHLWKNKVLDALPKILSTKKPGPKATSQVEILKEELTRLQKEYEALSQKTQLTVVAKHPSLLEQRPTRCPECGETHIWKNGTYKIKGKRTSHLVKEKGTIQRFLCSKCKVNLFLVKKNQNK